MKTDNQDDVRQEIARRLKQSTLTPAAYEPTETVKQDNHYAVWMNGLPTVLCGPAYNTKSKKLAEQLASSTKLHLLMQSIGRPTKDCHADTVRGADIYWPASVSSIAKTKSGAIEQGDATGKLVIIVLGDPKHSIATGLCIDTELARIIDPNVPELNRQDALPELTDEDLAALSDQDKDTPKK